MTLDALPRLSAALADRYRIERELGAGGMATVYLARDLKHERQVAIKVLRPELAAVIGAERFLSEIKTTANLQHPHILSLFDSGQVEGTVFYVMPFVDGESLRDRLVREKQLPIADALRIAGEVADALQYAHEHGVIHRDIKPENILLHGGHALVADFGIALAASKTGGSRMTETGMSLGTPQYMSPEQAMGERELDARTDVYALGCATYEMLTGEPPFTGPTAQAIVARVLTEAPRSLSLERKSIPTHVEAAVNTALEKLPADRFASAAAFATALNAPRASATANHTQSIVHAIGRLPPRAIMPILLMTAGVVAAVTYGGTRVLMHRGAGTGEQIAHVSVALPEGYELGAPELRPIAISHDGSHLAYVGLKDGKSQIFVRTLDEEQAKPLEGTAGGTGPFFSPTGEWIGFFADSKLKKIAASGAALQVLADAPVHRGGTWGDDGFIYFAPTNVGSIWRVPEGGGAATEFTHLNATAGEISHRWPYRVAGTSTLLFAVWTGPGDDEHGIAMQATGKQEHHQLLHGGDAPQYSVGLARLMYTRRGQLLTIPWQPSQTEVGGAVPVTAIEAVDDRRGNEGPGNFAVADRGTLIYLGGGESSDLRKLVWVSRTGALTPVPLPERAYENVAISPEGGRAAVQIREGTTGLWIYDFARGTLTPLHTGAGSNQAPVWTPDGTRLIYRGTRQGTRNLYWTRVDGSGEEERLTTKSGVVQTPTSVSSDGRAILYDEGGPDEPDGAGTWVISLDGDRTPRRLLPLPTSGKDGQLSPDGRWVAYQAIVSSRPEIFVAPFSGSGERRLVSTDGGTEALWSRDGRELFFQNGTQLMAATVRPGATFSASAPQLVYDGRFLPTINGNTSFTTTKDGSRFLRVQPVDSGRPITRIGVVFNWFSELLKRGGGSAH